MSEFELAIIGGGLASARAIGAYREAGGEGKIALISADSTIPYHRPPLSNRYVRGEAARDLLARADASVRLEDTFATPFDAGAKLPAS
jgi:NADPH-dependent 2,4-dienoyl-CoA reductase/sulfur reductase-like enzyme